MYRLTRPVATDNGRSKSSGLPNKMSTTLKKLTSFCRFILSSLFSRCQQGSHKGSIYKIPVQLGLNPVLFELVISGSISLSLYYHFRYPLGKVKWKATCLGSSILYIIIVQSQCSPTFSAAFCSHTRLGLKVNYVQQKNDFGRYLSLSINIRSHLSNRVLFFSVLGVATFQEWLFGGNPMPFDPLIGF